MQVDVYLPLHYPNATFSSFDTPKRLSGWIFWGMRWTDADFQSRVRKDKTARTWEPTWPKRNISSILTTLFETLTMFNRNTMYCHVNKGFPWTLRRAPFDSEGCGSRNNWSMARLTCSVYFGTLRSSCLTQWLEGAQVQGMQNKPKPSLLRKLWLEVCTSRVCKPEPCCHV